MIAVIETTTDVITDGHSLSDPSQRLSMQAGISIEIIKSLLISHFQNQVRLFLYETEHMSKPTVNVTQVQFLS